MKPAHTIVPLILLLAAIFTQQSFAQCNTTPCLTPTPSVNAQDACVLPNPAALDCYYGATTLDPPLSFPPWCGVVHNNHFFAFTADDPIAIFRISVFNCTDGTGLQAAILSTTDCIDFTVVSNCLGNIPDGTTGTLVASGITPGQVYYLSIDGSSASVCEYVINGEVPTVSGPVDGICINQPDMTQYSTAGPSQWRIEPASAGNIVGSNVGDTILVNWVAPGNALVCAENQACANAPIFCLPVTIGGGKHSETHATICNGEAYLFFGQILDSTGVYEATIPDKTGCDSTVTLFLDVLPHASLDLSVGICTGSYFIFQSDTIRDGGTYLYVLEAENGCDSLVTLRLEVADYFDTELSATICKGESYSFGGFDFDMEGVYVDSLKALGGCDSILTLTLTVLPLSGSDLSVSICDGASYIFHGDTVKDAGIYTHTETGSNGCDSLVNLHLTLVPYFETTLEASICEGSTYFFGAQTLNTAGIYTDTLMAIGGCDSTLILTLKVLPRSSGVDSATICEGELFVYQGDTLSAPGDYTFTLVGENGCDSTVTFSLEVLESPISTLHAVVCNGETYFFYGQQLSSSGVYEQVFVAENGCDSTVQLTLEVLLEIVVSVHADICSNEIYDFNGDTLTETGVYTQVLVSEFGCDSTVVLTLTVHPEQFTTLDRVICAGDSLFFDGQALTESGTYKAVFSDVNGCDSTVTLQLSVLPVKESNLEASICAGSTYAFNGGTLSDAGVYTAVLAGEYGCDSTVTLTLSVLPNSGSTIHATICEGSTYNYFGQVLMEAGIYEFNTTAENGCDSLVVVNLTVLPLSYGSLDAEICAGESYDFFGASLTETGTHTFTFQGENGCDSIFYVYLTVHPVTQTTLNVSRCSGQSYLFNGVELVTAGSYIAEYTSVYGCDSTVTLNLEFINFFESSLSASICAGEYFVFDTDTLNVAGDYTHLYTAVGGCDSTVTLTLTVLPNSQSENSAVICAGETYPFNGQNLAATGVYTALLTAFNGCDSSVVLNLTVLPGFSTTQDLSICAGETLAFNGAVLNESGTYTGIFTAQNGCDSTVTLHLTVLPGISSNQTATICTLESYDFNGQQLTVPGVYSATVPAANGCDSTITLTLTVLPLSFSTIEAYACNGQPYFYHGQALTQAGSYPYVFENGALNGCDSIVTLVLTFLPALPPTIINASTCAGVPYLYQGLAITQAGQYAFNLASIEGCDSTVLLNVSILPNSFTNLNAVLCNGGSIPFGDTLLTTPGLYTAVYDNYLGCDSIVTLTLTLDVSTVTIGLENGVLTAVSPNASFQWINCENNQPIPGANGSSYTPTVTGQYAVIAVSPAGCAVTSNCLSVTVSSVNEPLSGLSWILQPNPASDKTTILFAEPVAAAMSLELFDLTGRMLLQQAVEMGSSHIELELSGFPSGMLWVRLKNGQGSAVKPLMVAN